AIVSEVHGTTRDWLEGSVSLEGIPVRLFDTAGLRVTSDPLEAEGMRRTEQVISGADIVIYLVDSTRGKDRKDDAFMAGAAGVPVIRAWNKADLPGLPAPDGFILLSATTGAGLQQLEAAVAAEALGGAPAQSGEPLIHSVRQRDLIARALSALERLREGHAAGASADLLAVDLADALDALGEITGEVTTAEILERMFADFCVGK
ncbi:MAG TPA: GTP-binding protein, partial [bacterium]|nr:GTP-binding protein [bacterium]